MNIIISLGKRSLSKMQIIKPKCNCKMNVNFARGVDINIKKIYTFLDFCFVLNGQVLCLKLN